MNTNQITSFKSLSVGSKFEFYRPGMENSGMATGPWIKTSARCYRREHDGMKCEVGSIMTTVQPVD